jgi:ADP-ribosylglycohydrolase
LKSKIQAAFFGVAVGDALGVPVEFKSRESIKNNPVMDMIGYGTYNLPPGTWSDDSSLTFCLAEGLTHQFDLQVIAQNFVQWYHNNYWTATGYVFDIGIATRQAISRLTQGEKPEFSGGSAETDNGNGSLMRILPLVFYIQDKPIIERFDVTRKVSSITHGHIRSIVACFYYLEFARQLLAGNEKHAIYRNLQTEVTDFLLTQSIDSEELKQFDRLLRGDIFQLTEDEIQSGGYVLHTLEAGIWCLITTNSYKEAVLKAVNLGYDTDTTAAVTGGLAGLLYGYENIPGNWLEKIAQFNDICDLAERVSHGILITKGGNV